MASTRRRYPSKDTSQDFSSDSVAESPLTEEVAQETTPGPTVEPQATLEPVFVERCIKPQPVPDFLFEQKSEPEETVAPSASVPTPRGQKPPQKPQKRHPRNIPKFSRTTKE